MIRNGTALGACLLLGACAVSPGRVALPPAPPSGEPADMTGMTAEALRAAFGAPSFEREEGGAELWRYAGAGCQAFFFLYPDAGALKVRHVETLPRPRDAASDPDCLRSLRGSPPAPPVS